MRMDMEYEKMLEAYALTRRFLKQQMDLGFDQLYLSEKVESSPGSPSQELGDFYESIKNCQECHLHKHRNNLVFGMGSPQARVMFVGEAPGREEDLQGKPFVGRAGQLLDKILAAIDFKREEVYIGNVLKCRPPENRDPLPEEVLRYPQYKRQTWEDVQLLRKEYDKSVLT